MSDGLAKDNKHKLKKKKKNMIFAGDFVQLLPAIGSEHASLYSQTARRNPTLLYNQQAVIGKAL